MVLRMERRCQQGGSRLGQQDCSWPALSRRSLAVVASAQPAAAPGAGAGAKKAWAPPNALLKINPALLPGGLDVSRETPQAKASLDNHLSSLFFPVNLDHPGLRVLNIDPPVITIDDFLSGAECDDIVRTAAGSGLMRDSKVGVAGHEEKHMGDVRTSSTLAATTEALTQHPQLAAALQVMLTRARGLLRGPLPPDGPAAFCKPSAPGQLACELPQVARYQPGQHFLTHEDAFPLDVAAAKGYQRRCTLLVYLADCAQGGQTRFDILDIAVQPRKGAALLFFPSFINGVPDRRTLHTAQDAQDEKWITQLWVSVGVPKAPAPHANGMPAFVRGVKGAAAPTPRKGQKRGVPPQRVNTKV